MQCVWILPELRIHIIIPKQRDAWDIQLTWYSQHDTPNIYSRIGMQKLLFCKDLSPNIYSRIGMQKLLFCKDLKGALSLKKGVPSAVDFPHCAGSGEGLSLNPKLYPHKCAEAGARTRDLPVTDGRLYRCTRPALQRSIISIHFKTWCQVHMITFHKH